jgi:hypothetical protein
MAVKGVYIQGHRHEMVAVIHARDRKMIRCDYRRSYRNRIARKFTNAESRLADVRSGTPRYYLYSLQRCGPMIYSALNLADIGSLDFQL